MKLTDEDGIEYEFDGDSICANEIKGTLKKIGNLWPQKGDKYWHTGVDGYIYDGTYPSVVTQDRIEYGNFFQFQEEAEQHRDRIKSLKSTNLVNAYELVGSDRAKVTLDVPLEYLGAWEALSNET